MAHISKNAPAARTPGRGHLGAVIFATQPILLNAISIPVTAFIIRKLGATAYGEWNAANSMIVVASSLTGLGLRGEYVRAIASDPSEASALTADQIGLRLSLGAVAVLVAVAAAAALRYPGAAVACTAIAGLGLLLNSVSTTGADLFQASGRLPLAAAISTSAGLILTIASALAVGLGAGAVGLASAYLLGPLTSMVASAWMIRARHFPLRARWDVRRFFDRMYESRYFAAQQFVASSAQNAEVLFLPTIVGMKAYGSFSVGSLLVNRLTAIPDGLAAALYPIVAGDRGPDPGDRSRVIAGFMTLTLCFCMPLSVFCTFIADPIADLLLPADSPLVSLVIRITAWALPIAGVDLILGYCLNAAGMAPSQTRIVMISAGLSFATSVALVYRFGLTGAACSYVLRCCFGLALRWAEYRKRFGGPTHGVPVPRIAACTLLLWAGLRALHGGLWSPATVAVVPRTGPHWARMLSLLSIELAASLLIFGAAAFLLGVFAGLRDGAMTGVEGRR